ncbi:hypothetical protein ERO13_A09G091950v2 [Gossypium hirsutum]|nr:hypothetical protein ERO13_A09G091950v2 [Gossypium hirsutum]
MGEVVSTIPKTEQGVTQAIIHSAINFRREPWPKVSDNAKDLVKKCLILVQSSILQYRKCLGPGAGTSSDLPPAGAIVDSQLGEETRPSG